MSSAAQFVTAAEAAARLGVSAKALRLYEQRGLIQPVRTAAGWRTYGPDQMARAREIVALRHLGLGLAQVARVLGGEPAALELALAAHQERLAASIEATSSALARVRAMRAELAAGRAPELSELAELIGSAPSVAFDLPWPWGGERFELAGLDRLTWLTGPLGSGKTRLAMALAETLPGGRFLGLDRQPRPGAEPVIRPHLDWLIGEGATDTPAFRALLAGLVGSGEEPVVVDLVEQGLDAATQEELAVWLRQRAPDARPLVVMTRSTAMLDLDALRGETIIYCPANHAPPQVLRAWPGVPGLDLVSSCLAPPDVRARTEGAVAVRPAAA